MHGATNNFKMLTSPTSIVHTGYREAEGAGLECQRRWIGEEHAYTAPVVPSFTAAGWTASPGEAGGERTRGEGWGEEHIGSAAFSSSELRRLADASGWGDGSSPPIAAADVVAAPVADLGVVVQEVLRRPAAGAEPLDGLILREGGGRPGGPGHRG